MPRLFRRSPSDLPQLPETWHVAVRPLRIWIAPPGEDPARPLIVIIVNGTAGVIQKFDLAEAPPSSERMLELIRQAMQTPPPGVRQKAHRPSRIEFEDEHLAAAVAAGLEEIGISVEAHPRPEVVDPIVRELESSMREGQPEIPGLLSVKGVTPELVGGVFSAAAEFYRAAPWVQLADIHVLAVRVAWERQPRFGLVMGNGGMEYGLAMYRRWEDVERAFEEDDPFETLPLGGGHSLTFDAVDLVPFDDLEAMEHYGWEVAGKDAYPLPMVYPRLGPAKRPQRADLRWYEAALRAIPIFLRDHLRPDDRGDFLPAEATLSVPTQAGAASVLIRYPAGTLPSESRPAQGAVRSGLGEDEDLAAFDRRAMEGTLAQFASGLGGRRKGKAPFEQAQEVMYRAWEERDPGRRIILAHEALEISADCADAYVLLAEEEADTLGRALEYYQQGVAAGERALGKAYFEENAGDFWGLLETRPYMRALQGLADALWRLGRREESLVHYREMLRLNPGDNQGIRYTLLHAWLALNRDDEARALLDQYAEDGTAEWLYSRALLAFRAEGASQPARAALQAAVEQNPHVPLFLTGRKRIPGRLPPYVGWGDENEATVYAAAYLADWRRTPGAVDWLGRHAGAAPAAKPPAAKGRRRKRSARPDRVGSRSES